MFLFFGLTRLFESRFFYFIFVIPLSYIFLFSCNGNSANNVCDSKSKSYAETSVLLGMIGEKKHPCYPGFQILTNPGLNVSAKNGIISEAGGNALQGSALSFALSLGMEPKEPVSVQVIISNPSYATVIPTSFVWTKSDWSIIKNISVSAVNDTIINGNRNFSIRLVPTSDDSSMRLQDQIISMEILDNDKVIFTTTTSYTGALGGFTGADAICQADVKCPVGKVCKAMLVDNTSDSRVASNTPNLGDGQIAWVLKPFATYARNDDTSTVIGTTNANSLFTFPIVAIRPTSTTAWTGLAADWTSAVGLHCGEWALTSGNGNAGDTFATSSNAIRLNSFTCNSNLPFYCVEQ
ncbi:DUF1554 domain-containing protein [Leptospira kanakyensis]|uniref:DUF1554 domain-containing protein n=1 Tax=Leptospira kanakyensis TaxID=2484968 RepID=UPI00223DAB7F|nr:DUF1554 domain-containing protein [Leptospira kanakyensis]MCW7469764.1 DUF1554 domain-containing protein [Leptospira kanakyensis]MCW7480744.1 DUF1554 domain-containing protein [Leptospira kanakyensis]